MAAKMYLSGRAEDQPVDASELPHYKVLLILGSGFEDTEVATTLDIFGWTAYRPQLATVEVVKTGFHPTVRGAFGCMLETDLSFDQVDIADYDAVVVPGGFHNFGYGELYCETVYELIRAARQRRIPLASMCVGTSVFAQAGILEGGYATSYELSKRHDNVAMIEQCGGTATHQPMEEWDGIFSTTGPRPSEDVIMRLLEMVAGDETAREIARYRKGLKD